MKKDLALSAIIGILTGALLLVIFQNIKIQDQLGTELPLQAIVLVIPILFVLGMVVARLIGSKIPLFLQLAKFILVGILNTMMDLGVLNILVLATGVTMGFMVPAFKGISFVVAVTNSYFWNKFWTFKNSETQSVKPAGKEFLQFFVVSTIGLGINVGTASALLALGPQGSVSQELWINIAGIAATVFTLIWNFLGYKLIVFKNKETVRPI